MADTEPTRGEPCASNKHSFVGIEGHPSESYVCDVCFWTRGQVTERQAKLADAIERFVMEDETLVCLGEIVAADFEPANDGEDYIDLIVRCPKDTRVGHWNVEVRRVG